MTITYGKIPKNEKFKNLNDCNTATKSSSFLSHFQTGPAIKAAKTKKKVKSDSAPLIQTILNFGQKSVGILTCPDCNMKYNPLLDDDRVIHKKYHLASISLLHWKVEGLF
jgi:hypothetical protein